MKKILLFLLLFFVMGFVIAESAEIHGNMQIGYIPEIKGFETEINVQYLPWSFLTLYAGINVLMEASDHGTFYPYNDMYNVGVKINMTDHLYLDL